MPFWESCGSVRGSVSQRLLFEDGRIVYEDIAWILQNFDDADI